MCCKIIYLKPPWPMLFLQSKWTCSKHDRHPGWQNLCAPVRIRLQGKPSQKQRRLLFCTDQCIVCLPAVLCGFCIRAILGHQGVLTKSYIETKKVRLWQALILCYLLSTPCRLLVRTQDLLECRFHAAKEQCPVAH